MTPSQAAQEKPTSPRERLSALIDEVNAIPVTMGHGAIPRIAVIEAIETARREAAAATPSLDPSEIRDLDMALRYALLDHDMECRAIGMENNCTCPARGHFDRARATVKRIGAPYRKPSGDYDLGDES